MLKIFLVLFMSLLALLSVYSMLQLQNVFIVVNSVIVKAGVVLVMFFTVLIVLRYIFLIFFSLLRTIEKTAEDFTDVVLTKRVTILVPAYNEGIVIERSIESLMHQSYPYIEILVIDDGSSDDTYKLAKNFEFDDGNRSIRVLTKPNGGKSRALNYAIERAKGELIMVVDADSRLEDTAVELLVRHFENERIAAVAGSVYVCNRNNTVTRLQALEYIEGLNMVRNGQAFLKMVNIIPGPIGMFRRTVLDEVGLYDHDTFAEDCDLTLKMLAIGYQIDFEPDAVAYTEAPEELLDLIKQRYRWTRGILQAVRKHANYMFNPFKRFSMTFVLWYMLFEGVFWPFVDLIGQLLFVYISTTSGVSAFLFYWWSIFTVLDMSAALYCLLITRDDLKLVFYALLYRLYFVGVINMAKIFATVEEWFNIEMTWGKLERKGGI